MENKNIHTCSKQIGVFNYTWDVFSLWKIVENREEVNMPMSNFEFLFKSEIWEKANLTPEILLKHYSQVRECSLDYPILITMRGEAVKDVYDGFHRLVKAKYKSYETIKVKVLNEEELTKEGLYLKAVSVFCDVCGCDPCDCHWGDI